ncbi:DoxX-like protein [Dyadobacter jejuensis]|uniref:DoxX-like protein n=1 Tax=Dyadobacter jejuensis TaxID=1082580 RepID=A0A316APP8_9BACT|nr:DoxX family protein [Dyadobacter jejuensis]PWJ58790.1 DoxX-like protein [Dyadobacter jejuensis]
MKKQSPILTWILRGVAAIILFQSLFFKFSAADESVYIFSTLGMEPWGRIGSGVAESIAIVLLLIPATTALGALLGLAVMTGAIGAHLTQLGIVVQDDNGQLFLYACLVFLSCLFLVFIKKEQLTHLKDRFFRNGKE